MTLVVDQVPCDTVIKEDQDEGQESRSGSHEWDPTLSVQVREANNPGTGSSGFLQFKTLVGEEGGTGAVAALVGRLDLVGDVQLFGGNVHEQCLLDKGGSDNGHCDGEVMDGGTDSIVAEEGRELEGTEEEDQRSRSETEDGTEKGCFDEVVSFFGILLFVEGVIGLEVTEDTREREWITDSIHDEDRHNEKGEDLIEETRRKTDDTGKIEEGRQKAVDGEPGRDPNVEGKEVDVDGFGDRNEGPGKGQDRTCGSDDTQGHTTNQGVDDTDPGGGDDGLEGTDQVASGLGVGGTEGQGGGHDGEEHEEGNGNRLLVDVGHLLAPVGTDGLADIIDDTSSPHAGGRQLDGTGSRYELGVGKFLADGSFRIARHHRRWLTCFSFRLEVLLSKLTSYPKKMMFLWTKGGFFVFCFCFRACVSLLMLFDFVSIPKSKIKKSTGLT